jgi:hypothetical protein
MKCIAKMNSKLSKQLLALCLLSGVCGLLLLFSFCFSVWSHSLSAVRSSNTITLNQTSKILKEKPAFHSALSMKSSGVSIKYVKSAAPKRQKNEKNGG